MVHYYASRCTCCIRTLFPHLCDPDVLEVPPLQGEQLSPGDLVLQKGVAVHRQADALQPLGHLKKTIVRSTVLKRQG